MAKRFSKPGESARHTYYGHFCDFRCQKHLKGGGASPRKKRGPRLECPPDYATYGNKYRIYPLLAALGCKQNGAKN